MSRFTLLLGGDLVRTPSLDALISGTRVIAADSGMRHAATLDIVPELWVGDFDSVPQDMIDAYPHVPRRVFPPEKDKTDGELAIAAALEAGATGLTLAGAFGGERPDHMFLHLTQALQLSERGIDARLTSGAQEGLPLALGRRHLFDYPQDMLFSILAFSPLSGLTVEGAKWPLDAVEVAFGSSLTLSNAVDGRLAVTLEKGRALLVAHLLDDGAH
ncbi:thiamine diphosphokinase [Nitratireductor pacificus]|uniref:Thiamine diphosphokinase n=1 Tax=Nitratireductor pacificus pht-3B TaxID=391937 RepID=K2M9Y1_9HYPH|nr:thiamine diphosphokinase [Nitratireductor pacificus]EKF18956.1 thiamine pyrophosphokinase [Nitratireductor pacificus pht-3B]